MPELVSENRIKREEAVGAPIEVKGPTGLKNRRDSYEDVDDEESANSREEIKERHREGSTERKRFDFERKAP